MSRSSPRSIDLATGEATIIGKGNKERVVFFSPRALNWIKEYLTRRSDSAEALSSTVARVVAIAD